MEGGVKMDITKREIENYVEVQMSGRTNMYDIRTVGILTGMNKETLLKIMDNYDELVKKYGIDNE